MNEVPIVPWMQAYVEAWASDDPRDVSALFAEDARYFTEPYAEPWEGREEIVRQWIAHGDSAIDWSFTYEVIALDGDAAVVQGHTVYAEQGEPDPKPRKEYENLWVIRFAPDGRAREFTEWWMRTKTP